MSGAVGATTQLGDVTVTNAANVTASSTFAANSFTQVAGTGTTTFLDAITLTGNFDFTGNNLNLDSVNPSSIGGFMEVTNAGNFITEANTDVTVNGAFTQNGVGANSLGGDITSTTAGISFATAVTLTNEVLMNTAGGGGDMLRPALLKGYSGPPPPAGG